MNYAATVPDHDNDRYATRQHTGRTEMQELHDAVKSPPAAKEQAADQQREERGCRDPVDDSLGHGEARDPTHEMSTNL